MTTRTGTRQGRRAAVLSPRDLPSELRSQIEAEAVYGGLSARVLFARHDLGGLGINSRTFRKYVADCRQEEALAAQVASTKAHRDTTRRVARRGRPAGVLSPRDLPKAMQSRIKSEAIKGRLSAREIYARHDLGALGINSRTFRKYVAGFRKGKSLSFRMPSIAVRSETAARALLLLLESRMTSQGASSVVAIMAKDRLGVLPVKAPKGPFSARFMSLARYMGAFLASLCTRAEVDKITLALCFWKYGKGWADHSRSPRQGRGGNR